MKQTTCRKTLWPTKLYKIYIYRSMNYFNLSPQIKYYDYHCKFVFHILSYMMWKKTKRQEKRENILQAVTSQSTHFDRKGNRITRHCHSVSRANMFNNSDVPHEVVCRLQMVKSRRVANLVRSFVNYFVLILSPGGYSTLVWVGVCRWDFWNATHPCTHFEGKMTHPCTKNQNFSLTFAPFWCKFRKILKSWPIKVPNLRHFGANFRKFWKIDPSKYHVFEKKGPIDVPGGLILLPMFAAHPYNHFCTEYPPPGF